MRIKKRQNDENYQASHQKPFLTDSIDFGSIIIAVFVLLNNCYQLERQALKILSPKTKLDESLYLLKDKSNNNITLGLMIDCLSFIDETFGRSRISQGKMLKPWKFPLRAETYLLIYTIDKTQNTLSKIAKRKF